MADQRQAETKPITIKKYANRRLYNTATSSYVTLDHLARMVKEGTEFQVFDAKTGEDITRSVLTQIIVEEEAKGPNLLPINFLRHLISFYGDSLQALVPRYLDHTMQTFATNQEQMRAYIRSTMNGLFPFVPFEEMGKQNMALLDQAMKMFAPFYGGADKANGAGGAKDAKAQNAPAGSGEKGTAAAEGAAHEGKIDELRHRLNEMQRQIDALKGQEKDTR